MVSCFQASIPPRLLNRRFSSADFGMVRCHCNLQARRIYQLKVDCTILVEVFFLHVWRGSTGLHCVQSIGPLGMFQVEHGHSRSLTFSSR